MRAAEAAAPVSDGELDSLFQDIAGATRVALAVSGGADSLALLDCIERWRRPRCAPDILVLTVDHGLRAESAAEAGMVAGVAAARGLTHRTLRWDGPYPDAGDMEAEARRARYRLLLGACREVGASHLLVAHHRDDQAETFLMRLSRGSGLFGLAAMRPSVRAGEVTILRPLLDLPRSRLAATVAAAGLVPADDPMNRDPRFLRARLRRVMPLLTAEGFDPATLAATAARLRLAADAIEEAAGAAIARHVMADALAIAWVDPGLFDEPAEVCLRVIARIVMAIGGEPYPPRSERLGALERAMASHRRGRFKRTLGGTVVEWRGTQFALYRELGREPIASRPLAGESAFTWDGRFRVEAEVGIGEDLAVAPLGEDGRLAIGAGGSAAPAGALAALPAIRRGSVILAVPPLGYGATRAGVTIEERLAAKLAEPPGFPTFEGE